MLLPLPAAPSMATTRGVTATPRRRPRASGGAGRSPGTRRRPTRSRRCRKVPGQPGPSRRTPSPSDGRRPIGRTRPTTLPHRPRGRRPPPTASPPSERIPSREDREPVALLHTELGATLESRGARRRVRRARRGAAPRRSRGASRWRRRGRVGARRPERDACSRPALPTHDPSTSISTSRPILPSTSRKRSRVGFRPTPDDRDVPAA